MKISTRGRYALRMMLDLAQHRNQGFIALKDIAERQHISKKYLEQIIPMLGKFKMLKTSRGFQGGYMLAKDPYLYKVGDILRICEGNLAPVTCLEQEANDCPYHNECLTLPLWEGLYKVITDYLDSVTLQDLLDKQQSAASDYVI